MSVSYADVKKSSPTQQQSPSLGIQNEQRGASGVCPVATLSGPRVTTMASDPSARIIAVSKYALDMTIVVGTEMVTSSVE